MTEDDDEDFRIFETTAISRVETVRLYDETWDHIAEQHPEFAQRLPSLEHAIADTLKNPTLVCESTTQPGTSVVYASSNNIKGDGHMLSVPVRILGDTTSARVTTALFGSPPRGNVIYKKGNDDA